MPNVVLSPDEFRYMQIFHELTGVMPIDCIVDDEHNRIIFLVHAKDVGRAIGRRGSKVRWLRDAFKRNVEVVGYSEKLEEMVANALAPAKVQNVRVVQTPKGKVVYAKVDPRYKGMAIGKDGRNVSRARLILKRHFDIDSLVVV
jgi:N utilization substance protein A